MCRSISISIRCLVLAALCAIYAAHLNAEDTAAPKKPSSLRIASVSIFPEKWNKVANADKIEKLVRDAAKQGAQLIITPEGVLEGYLINEVNHERDAQKKRELTEKFYAAAEPLDGPFAKRFAALADEVNVHLILGLLERDGDKLYNTAALFGPDGKLAGKYHKTHFAQGYDANPPGYLPGDSYPVFDIGPLKVGMMICFDRQPPEPARHLALNGADLIACPSYGSRGDWNTRLMQVRAYENQTYVIFTHPEETLIIDRHGDLLATGEQDQIVIHDLDLTNLKKTRNTITNRRPQTYKQDAAPQN